MRRIVMLMVSVVLVLSLVPVMAQDEMLTIGEIVVASSEADEPEFTTLLAAVGAADESVLEALVDREAELTVFAPTDAAFAELTEALGEEAFLALLEDSDAMTDILLYHVVDGAVMSGDVVELLAESDGEFEVETLNGQYIDVAGSVEDGITLDNANLVLEMVDIEASNGVIHVIDAVIVPELRTVAEIVVESAEAEEPEFATLLAAVVAADEGVLELLSDAEAELTVFAPTDAAFAALGEDTLAAVLADTELLTAILNYHVVGGVVYSWDVVELLDANMGEFEVEMASGDMALVSADEDGIYIDDATIVITDIEAANGVIHVIDAVILPEAE